VERYEVLSGFCLWLLRRSVLGSGFVVVCGDMRLTAVSRRICGRRLRLAVSMKVKLGSPVYRDRLSL